MSFRTYTVLCLSLVLSGCDAPKVQMAAPSPVVFQPVAINASGVNFQPPAGIPSGNPWKDDLVKVIENWSLTFFQPTGTGDMAEISVVSAIAEDTPLPLPSGPGALFTTYQGGRLLARVVVRVASPSMVGGSQIWEASAARSQTYPENVTLAEKEAIWNQLTQGIIAALATEFQKNVGV